MLKFTKPDKPKAAERLMSAAKEMRAIARGEAEPASVRQPKKLQTLRLDVDVIEKFKATGPGWQARMNEALRKATP